MKGAAIFILVLSAIVSASIALPIEPDSTSEVKNVHTHVPDGPVVEEKDASEQEIPTRERRAANPGDSKGSVGVSVENESKRGTKLQVDADRVLWQSKDGRARLEGAGQVSTMIDGPARGKSDVAGFINFKGDF